MRKLNLFNSNWTFTKESIDQPVNLPHTWNAEDGQDGGNDYYRGKCWYTKRFAKPDINIGDEVWLEFRGVNMVAQVYLNGNLLSTHSGGYSTFRVNLTSDLQAENVLSVSADNSPSRTVYPQKADFTFYGGIYRDVYLITVPKTHFALGHNGSQGIQVTPEIKGDTAEVTITAWLENATDGTPVRISIQDVAEVDTDVIDGRASTTITIPNVHLWNGTDDPWMYTAYAMLADGTDMVETRFGCRTYSIDPEKGFYLNGRSYPLCGAARHQDWQGAGYAITKDMHIRDIELLKEMGANTVRLAHYQHGQYFYDLCDQAGMVVWAEIPYITEHFPEGVENTLTQMTELVVQNYNHPSIICWGLSNEITAASEINDDLIENHRRLNNLCHKLDSTRPTTMAHVFMLPTDNELVRIPDICSYNLYYGWYLGDLDDNDEFFDNFHSKYPQSVIGLSEYGADANPQFQSPNPERGDYTESYQALYHEHMLEMWSKRPYIWAMHVWNMFDFAADGRDEGGKHGINQKGLVTFDRKTKKDAFYIYKAWLSKEPFVHLCGRRYVDRTEDLTTIKVYSNQPSVTLYVDGNEIASQSGNKVFLFLVPILGSHSIVAKSGNCSDAMDIRKVTEPNPNYMQPGSSIINWFDKDELEVKEGFYSIKDTISDIKKSPAGAQLLAGLMQAAVASRGDVAKNIKMPESMQQMIDRQSLEKLLKQVANTVFPDDIVKLNKALNQIPKN